MGQQYALILGASSGFGKAIGLALAKDGVNIIGVHLDRATTMPAVEQLISDIKAEGVEAHFFNVNAADEEKRKMIVDKIKDEIFAGKDNPTIRVLVHSLAFGTLVNFIDDDPSKMITQRQINMTLDVMACSLVYWAQDIVASGLMGKGGKIYAMTSSGGTRQIEFYGSVSAAKASLESFVRQLAMELAPKGIAVNALKAGVTDTPALQRIPNADKIIENAKQRNPMHILTDPHDVADFVVDNYKRDSHWVTGNIIGIDGGESIVEI